ncbi:cytoplasmic protein [candidate division KSB1 bacterium]|nr:cytoplasmic protein [candidate division KSB1 bacterium]
MKSAFSLSQRHREWLDRSRRCACFHCLAVFSRREIQKWSDSGQTALCPRCGIDAVLPGAAGLPIRRRFLCDMRKHWFNLH